MVPIVSLWLPIVLSAVMVFVASSLMHMVLRYHRSDFAPLPSEDAVMDAMHQAGIPPGEYVMPYAGSHQAMKDPAFLEKVKRGPVAFITVMTSDMGMTKSLVLWFAYSLAVSVISAYVTGRAVGPGAEYLEVFRFSGCTSFVAYSVALWQNSIWYKRKWSTTLKMNVDGLVYSLLTAGAFGWLWPA